MILREHVRKMDSLISQGEILDAVDQFFDDHATTSDYGRVATSGKNQMLEKMEGFLGAISQVNGIKHHRTIVDGDSSASEFTFDFEMKDGTSIHWHEIIRRVWTGDMKVAHEEYFNAA